MGDGQPGDSASGVDSYDAATEYTEDTEVDGESYSSTGTDENAILVSNGATASLKNITVTRISSDSTGGDNSSFYGVGAAVLTTDGTLYAWDLNVEAEGANGSDCTFTADDQDMEGAVIWDSISQLAREERGRNEGENEGKRKKAKNLIKMGMPIEQIAQAVEEDINVVKEWIA